MLTGNLDYQIAEVLEVETECRIGRLTPFDVTGWSFRV